MYAVKHLDRINRERFWKPEYIKFLPIKFVETNFFCLLGKQELPQSRPFWNSLQIFIIEKIDLLYV